MSNAVISIELPELALQDAAAVAEKSGMSVDQWIAFTVEERLRNERLTEEFLRRRAAGASGRSLMEILDGAPDREPEPGDELE